MRKIFFGFLFLAVFEVCFTAQMLYAGGDARARYDQAIRCIKLKQADFAFMEFRSIVRDFPKNPLAQKSIFAMAEYYYDQKMYYDAVKNFKDYIQGYPDSKANVFAKAYLLKITEEIKDPTWEEKRMFENINKEFFTESLYILFKQYKKPLYRSPLLNKFKINYYVDYIEVYRNDQVFLMLKP